MISIDAYSVIIGEEDLVALSRVDERVAYADLTAEQKTAFDAEIEAAEKHSVAIITQKFGKEPTDADFLEAATVAGVVYLMSRKPHNQIAKDQVDQRAEHFFGMLPNTAGSVTQAEIQVSATKLGEWI